MHNMIDNHIVAFLLVLMISFILFSGIRFYKNYSTCTTNYPKLPQQDNKYVSDALIKSAIAVGAAGFVVMMAPHASHLPIVGMPFKIMAWLDYKLPGLPLSIILAVIHLLYNLLGNTPSAQQSICAES